jgi:hypothetical protein
VAAQADRLVRLRDGLIDSDDADGESTQRAHRGLSRSCLFKGTA